MAHIFQAIRTRDEIIMLAEQIEIPEPTPIGPEGIHEIVSQLSLHHVAQWSKFDPFHDFFLLSQNQESLSPTLKIDSVLSFNDPLPSAYSIEVVESIQNETDGFMFDEGDDATEIFETSTRSLSNVSFFPNNEKLMPISRTITDTKEKGVTCQKIRKARWNDRFQDLIAFQKKTGHLAVPNTYPPNQMVRM